MTAKLFVVGIGPGGFGDITERARVALEKSDAIVGYTTYIKLIEPFIKEKEVFSTGMTKEVERCRTAIELARSGRPTALVCSGDSGIYGMAGLVYEILGEEKGEDKAEVEVEVVSGVPAFVAAAAILGAPLMHDFASISLSDLLTPWETIKKRLDSAAAADFVIILYNPKSRSRTWQLGEALEIISKHRGGDTPVGIVRNATREGEEARVIKLSEAAAHDGDSIDMKTLLVVGNSTSRVTGGRIITPRGYKEAGRMDE